MTDRAPEVAAYLVKRHADDIGPDVLWAEMSRLWPGLTSEEGVRAAQIAEEILAGRITKNTVTRDAVKTTLAQRRASSPVRTRNAGGG